MRNSVGHCIFLSYPLCPATPSYGDRERFHISRSSDISRGDAVTNSRIETSVHVGTHIDLPAHFHAGGQTLTSYPAEFWVFEQVLLVLVVPQGKVLHSEVIDALATHVGKDVELLLIKTGMGSVRDREEYWRENVGLHPGVRDYLARHFPGVRVVGFDSISVSSLTDRALGREAHLRFLDPSAPVLLLEDMDLRSVDSSTVFERVTVAPLLIEACEALPCTVIGEVHD